jgi:DNA-binding IclR family transcriptional regulator
MAKAEAVERNGIQVIARAASVLRALKGSAAGMSLGQIAERVDLPRSTVQRIVGALQAERLVTVSVAGSGIRLGPELHALAESARLPVMEMVRPLLQELSRRTEETVDLSVLRGQVLVFIDQIPGTQRLRAVSSVGEEFPLTTTANGKACLALMDDADIARLAGAEWAATGTPHDLAAFMAEIEAIRTSGVAIDRDEHTAGISAVGIAFRDWKGDIHAVSVPTPSARFASDKPMLVRSIARLKIEIEKLIDR